MAALGKPGQDVERALQVRDRLVGGRAADRQLARLAPEFDRLLVQAGFGAVLRDQLGRFSKTSGSPRRARDPPVQLGAALAQHGVVRGLLDQDVLEGVPASGGSPRPNTSSAALSWRKAPCSSVSGSPATAASS